MARLATDSFGRTGALLGSNTDGPGTVYTWTNASTTEPSCTFHCASGVAYHTTDNAYSSVSNSFNRSTHWLNSWGGGANYIVQANVIYLGRFTPCGSWIDNLGNSHNQCDNWLNVIARLTWPHQFYCASFSQLSSTLYLRKFAAGPTITTLATVPLVIPAGTGQVIGIGVNGTTVSLYSGGSVVASVTDATYATGAPGLMGEGYLYDGTGLEFDDWYVDSTGSGTGSFNPKQDERHKFFGVSGVRVN